MNFSDKNIKTFLIGMMASMSAVIAWDMVKKSLRIFNYEVKDSK